MPRQVVEDMFLVGELPPLQYSDHPRKIVEMNNKSSIG